MRNRGAKRPVRVEFVDCGADGVVEDNSVRIRQVIDVRRHLKTQVRHCVGKVEKECFILMILYPLQGFCGHGVVGVYVPIVFLVPKAAVQYLEAAIVVGAGNVYGRAVLGG